MIMLYNYNNSLGDSISRINLFIIAQSKRDVLNQVFVIAITCAALQLTFFGINNLFVMAFYEFQ